MSDGSLEARHEYARGDNEARDARARRMLEDFGARAKAAGVEAEIVDFDDPNNPQPRDVPQFARSFDPRRRRAGRAGTAAEHERLGRRGDRRKRASRHRRARHSARAGAFRTDRGGLGRQLGRRARDRRRRASARTRRACRNRRRELRGRIAIRRIGRRAHRAPVRPAGRRGELPAHSGRRRPRQYSAVPRRRYQLRT